MDQFIQALWGLAALAVTTLAGVGIPLVRAHFTNMIQQRLGEGAARVAGEIAAKVAGDPALQVASAALVNAGVEAMKVRFPDTAGKLATGTLAGMITGELGKIGQGVAPNATRLTP